MALEKTIMTDYGVNATYWRVYRIASSFGSNPETTFILAGYADDAARLANVDGAMLSKKQFVVTGETSRADAYMHVKTLPEFDQALDV